MDDYNSVMFEGVLSPYSKTFKVGDRNFDNAVIQPIKDSIDMLVQQVEYYKEEVIAAVDRIQQYEERDRIAAAKATEKMFEGAGYVDPNVWTGTYWYNRTKQGDDS